LLAAGVLLRAPHVALACETAARRVLPLRFGRQALAAPLRIRDRVVPRDLYDRMPIHLGRERVNSVGLAPTCAGLPLPPPTVLLLGVEDQRAGNQRLFRRRRSPGRR